MPLVILALFIGVPLIEIYLFIAVGGLIGVWPTIGLVIVTALLGTWLLRQQGLATLARAQAELREDRLPMRELFDGVCLLFGGALLLTPGFMTDAVGFTLLVPQLRNLFGKAVWKLFASSRGVKFSVYSSGPQPGPGGTNPGTGRGPVIDGEEFGVERDERPSGADDDETRRLGGRS